MNISEDTSGEWSVKKKEGITHLYKGTTLVMSDSLNEKQRLKEFEERVHGDVLISGLGLGLAISMALNKDEVKSIVVNEISSDVLKLVAPFYCNEARLFFNKANAYTWEPLDKQRFDIIWHDISHSDKVITLNEISRLYKRYSRFLKEGGWQASWEAAVLGIEIKETS